MQREKTGLKDLQSKADELANLIKQRSFWPELLNDFNSRIVPNVWVLSLTPMNSANAGDTTSGNPAGGMFRLRPNPDSGSGVSDEAGPSKIGPIDMIQIEGEGNPPDAAFKLVNDFVKNLGESSFVASNGVNLVRPPSVSGSTFTFLLRVTLVKPITFQ